MAYNTDFYRQTYDIRDIKAIFKRVEYSESWVGSKPLTLVGASLGS